MRAREPQRGLRKRACKVSCILPTLEHGDTPGTWGSSGQVLVTNFLAAAEKRDCPLSAIPWSTRVWRPPEDNGGSVEWKLWLLQLRR